MADISPMMKQYMAIKERHKDCILLFRLGDFYEMFFDDAKTASDVLGLTLTGKDYGQKERAPMCGMPYHSSDSYIAKLIEYGFKVAICEQMEDPATAKGIVKREVVRIITPGTVIEENMLSEEQNNYLASVCVINGQCGVCFIDVSTGAVRSSVCEENNIEQFLINETGRFSPSELLIDSSINIMHDFKTFIEKKLECKVNVLPDEFYINGLDGSNILSHFNAPNLESVSLKRGNVDTAAFDVALRYIANNGMKGLSTLKKVSSYSGSELMHLDVNAVRNLELFGTLRGNKKKGSLLWTINKTCTVMGSRLMRSFLEQPLISVTDILKRQNAINELYSDNLLREELRELLSGIGDIERLMTRISYGKATGREMITIAFAASKFAPLKTTLKSCSSKLLKKIHNNIDELYDIIEIIESAIVDKPPTTIKEGGIIKDGYSAELDSLRAILNGNAGILAKIESEEKEKTGIKNLKVGFNRVFGYYIEVTKSFVSMVPENYIRKQTLTNCERYITEELKEIEGKILGAKDRSMALEYELFQQIRKKVSDAVERFQKTAEAISELDVYCSLAKVAVENRYICPKINSDGVISITDGRHPVVEKLSDEPFVANDTYLDMNDFRCAIITGPNMAGKSTYMRQVAIISLLTQIGSFVPASAANMCIVDAIYTRVGASDDLSMGQSTFMVEMSEVADIVKNATKNSLIIYDEIGRGTSTYDGMSIAKSVLEFTASTKTLGAKTLFATHYHELTAMEEQIQGVKNYNIAVKKHGDDITFLRRIIPGGADDSYGIEVAKLSGIPDKIINRAKTILKSIEENGIVMPAAVHENEQQKLPLNDVSYEKFINKLKQLDVNVLTPIEALKELNDIIQEAKNL